MNDKTKTTPTKRAKGNHPVVMACFSLLGACFAFAAAYAVMTPDFGRYWQVGHWDIRQLDIVLGVLALASMLAAVVVSKVPKRWPAWGAAFMGMGVWLLALLIFCLFVFRYPVSPSFQHSKHRVEDNDDGLLEQFTIGFNAQTTLHKYGMWGNAKEYSLTQRKPGYGARCFRDASECPVMECLSRDTDWFFGLRISHSWHVLPTALEKDLVNAQCRQVDPEKLDMSLYSDMRTRRVYPEEK